MTRIPRDLIKHLEWNPSKQPPAPQSPPPQPPARELDIIAKEQINLDAILNGKSFYEAKSLDSLKKAMEYATPEGIIPTMPEFVAAKAKADKTHPVWQNWHSVLTEENIGIARIGGEGYRSGDAVLVVVHGGGLLTPARIQKAYDDKLVNGSARYADDEFNDLLAGKLADGTKIPILSLLDAVELEKNCVALERRFGVVLPYVTAQTTTSGSQDKKEWLGNPLVLARTAGHQYCLETFFDKAQSGGKVGNYHPFAGRNASVPQGRLLYVNLTSGGLYGYLGLDNDGRFVGVAPEALVAKKI